jgi:hypothetical protein
MLRGVSDAALVVYSWLSHSLGRKRTSLRHRRPVFRTTSSPSDLFTVSMRSVIFRITML